MATIDLVTLVAADYEGDRIVNTAVVPLQGDPTPENNTSTERTPGPQDEEPEIITGRTSPPALPFTGGDTAAVALAALLLLWQSSWQGP